MAGRRGNVVQTDVVLATHNPHKVEEFQRILGEKIAGLRLIAYDGPEPVENGTSFAQNALIKARAAAANTGMISLADDSGICVDVLGGAPGIFSARWAGAHGDPAANLRLLLDQLADIREEDRGAQFWCTIALVVPAGNRAPDSEHVVDGIWPGRLATAPRGTNGFGYDPVFLPDGFGLTSAELSPEVKNSNSHRARAFGSIVPLLVNSIYA